MLGTLMSSHNLNPISHPGNLCRILTKITYIPDRLKAFLRDSDILFAWTEAWVVVDDESELLYPYEYELDDEIIRLDKRALQLFDDTELAYLLFQAKMERESYLICKDVDLALQNADFISQQRYPKSLLSSVQQKIAELY